MYKHLDEQNMEQYGKAWIPAIPLPYYHSSIRKAMSFKTNHVYICGCQARFSNEAAYREHYRTEQMIEMNHAIGKNRDMAKIKATYWRRRAFVFEHGTTREGDEMARIETPELHDKEAIMALLARVTDLWAPVYRRYAEANDITVGQVKDDTTIEDETPEDPAHGN
jgi:hypothetical protein